MDRSMRCAVCGAEFEPDRSALQDAAIAFGAADRVLACASCEGAAQRASADRERSPSRPDAVKLHKAPPLSFSAETADDLDECEVLLRRAIEMVREAVHRPEPVSETSGHASHTPTELADLQPLDQGPSAPVASVAEHDLDECELLLGRAIAMVRGPVGRTRPIRGLTDASRFAATQPSGSVRIERLPVSRAVAIQHDTLGGYVAIDAKTGQSLLRHENARQLSTMCDRIGWQVIGGERARAGE